MLLNSYFKNFLKSLGLKNVNSKFFKKYRYFFYRNKQNNKTPNVGISKVKKTFSSIAIEYPLAKVILYKKNLKFWRTRKSFWKKNDLFIKTKYVKTTSTSTNFLYNNLDCISFLYLKNFHKIFAKKFFSVDFFFKSSFMYAFIKNFNESGRFSIGYKNFLKLFQIMHLSYKISPFLMFFQIFFFIKLPLKLRTFIKSGRIQYYPAILPLYNQYTFAIKVLKQNILKRHELSFILKVLAEIIDVLFNFSGNTMLSLRNNMDSAIGLKTAIKYRTFS